MHYVSQNYIKHLVITPSLISEIFKFITLVHFMGITLKLIANWVKTKVKKMMVNIFIKIIQVSKLNYNTLMIKKQKQQYTNYLYKC